jgi:membrane fusion protein (multidrug efflux system)
MPTPFSRSLRSLAADDFRWSRWCIVFAAVVLGLAAVWFFRADIPLYEISRTARLEVEQEVHPVAAPVAGRVVATHLQLGQEVEAGALLLELDSQNQQLRAEEERATLTKLSRQLEALRDELAATEQGWPEEQKAALLAVDEARARRTEADAAAQLAEQEVARLKKLFDSALLSKADFERGEAEGKQKRAAAAAQGLSVNKLSSEADAKQPAHQIRAAHLKSEIALVEGGIATTTASVKRCEYDIEQRRIRSPLAGRVGELANLRIGAFVAEGEKIGAIVPAGELRAVAQFPPWTSLGRIRPGQSARLRLDGFPWTQFGTVPAIVSQVANEPREGLLRVELKLLPDPRSLIPRQHGLAGTTEVKVDRVSPATLVLRAAGKLIARERAAPQTSRAGKGGIDAESR